MLRNNPELTTARPPESRPFRSAQPRNDFAFLRYSRAQKGLPARVKPFFALVLGAVLASTAVAAAVNNPCSGPNLPFIEVVPRLADPKMNLNTPAEQLSFAAQITRPGDTDGITDFQVSGEITLQESATPGGCPAKAIRVVVKPSRLEVYIAKENLPSSCRFKAVLDHEFKHVLLAQRAMDRSATPLKRRLTAALALLPANEIRTVDALRVALTPVVNAQLAVQVAEYAESSLELDSPAEARRMAEMCQGPRSFIGTQVLLESSTAE